MSVKRLNIKEVNENKRNKPVGNICQMYNCGKAVDPVFIDPVFFKGTIVLGTGIWEIPLYCDVCLERLKESSRLLEIKNKRNRIMANCGMDYKHFEMDCEYCKSKKERICPFTNMDLLKENIFVHGETGRCKTGCAVSCAKNMLKRKKRVKFKLFSVKVMAEIRGCIANGFGSRDQWHHIIDRLLDCDYLVLDELLEGRVPEKEKAQIGEILYYLFDLIERKKKKGIFITCQFPMKYVASLRPNVAGRISGNFEVIEFCGRNHRL